MANNPRHMENLLPGGVPGNKGGTGRPPDEIRKRFREVLAGAGMDRVEAIITKAEDGDVLKAVDLCGKYGLGDAQQYLEDAKIFEALGETLVEFFPGDAEKCGAFLESLKGRLAR